MLDDIRLPASRKVWEHSNGSLMLTVTGLLQPGRYEIQREIKDDGTVVLTCEPECES